MMHAGCAVSCAQVANNVAMLLLEDQARVANVTLKHHMMNGDVKQRNTGQHLTNSKCVTLGKGRVWLPSRRIGEP